MSYSTLSTSRLHTGTCISSAFPPNLEHLVLDSPALGTMTDLAQVKAATIGPGTLLGQAEKNMIYQGVRLLFVVSDMPCVDGVVTAYDLHGDKPIRLITQRHMRHTELCVADVMTPLSELDTVDFASLAYASVGQLMATFNKTGHLHLLVVEAASAKASARIRGVISKTQVQRQLGLPLDGTEIATTFTELSKALA